MGDLIGQEVAGKLAYFPSKELSRVRGEDSKSLEHISLFADMCRLNALYMIARAGSGHIGSSFSSLDIISYLVLSELDIGKSAKDGKDIFFSSKGHDAPAYYAALMGIGSIDFELIHKLRKIDGLPGHPDIQTRGIVTNTGSLGMGVSKAKGMIHANRLMGRTGRVVVMTGDGELQEGQFWESLISAANHELSELIVIIDHNKLQSDTFVKNVSDLGDLKQKLEAYGWCVARCDGNDMQALSQTFQDIRLDSRPKVIIADTVKGKGVSFMEHTSLDSDVDMYAFHSGAPNRDAYQEALVEIAERVGEKAERLGLGPLELETVSVEGPIPTQKTLSKLIPAYSDALVALAVRRRDIVALDADLVLDTGLIPFREKFPERFLECGIAEQDMVSIAGGMALGGILPVVHSFACFLSARPNEQIYNNATERTKIVYVGSLAGVLPGGPGHSHQAVRDVASLGAIPGLEIVEPSCPDEVGRLLDWCVDEHSGSSYMRLTSIPCDIPFSFQEDKETVHGRGHVLWEGEEIAVISHGPIMLSQAYTVAKRLAEEQKAFVKVINMPWLNSVDNDWLRDVIAGCYAVVCIDNHYGRGALSDTISKAIAKAEDLNVTFSHLSLTEIPPSGTNEQVLEETGLNENAIYTHLSSVKKAQESEKKRINRSAVTKVTENYVLWTENQLEKYRCETFRTKEAETVSWIETVIEDGDVLYDVGANIGLYGIYAGLMHSQSKVYAFEPLVRNFNRLVENIQLNNCDNVIPLHFALSNKGGIEKLYVSDERVGGSGSQVGSPVNDAGKEFEPISSEHTPVVCLDDLETQFGIPLPDHIKIDVDGLEAQIVQGMRKVLSTGHVKSVLVELNKEVTNQAEVYAVMERYGYNTSHPLNSHPSHSRHRRNSADRGNIENVVFVKST